MEKTEFNEKVQEAIDSLCRIQALCSLEKLETSTSEEWDAVQERMKREFRYILLRFAKNIGMNI